MVLAAVVDMAAELVILREWQKVKVVAGDKVVTKVVVGVAKAKEAGVETKVVVKPAAKVAGEAAMVVTKVAATEAVTAKLQAAEQPVAWEAAMEAVNKAATEAVVPCDRKAWAAEVEAVTDQLPMAAAAEAVVEAAAAEAVDAEAATKKIPLRLTMIVLKPNSLVQYLLEIYKLAVTYRLKHE